MIVESMNESAIYAIGHAFGYYDYGEETGMVYAFFGQEPTAQYICAYVRGMLRGGFLHTTSERGEGYIAYKRPKEKLGFKTLWPIATGMLHNSSMKRLMRFAMAIKKGGKSLQERMDKEKKPYIFVGMVCVCEKYQGQGYMRKVMDIAFAEGNRLHVPVILETDAKSKCDKYVHLGMELAGTRDLGEFGKMPFRQKRRAKAAAGEGVPSAEKARRTGRAAIFIKGKKPLHRTGGGAFMVFATKKHLSTKSLKK